MQVFVYCSILLLESCSGSLELPKRARGFQRSVWVSFLLSTNTLSLFMSLLHPCRALHTHTHTGMHRHTKTRVHTCRRCHVTIFSHSGVSLPHDNCEFNWCCHMVCNGVSSDCRGCVKETQIFLEEKRRLSRAGIKKKKNAPFLISFSSPLTLSLLKCKLPNTSCGGKTWHIQQLLPLC